VIEKASAHPLIQIKHLASRRVLAVPLIVVVGMASFMSIFALLMPIWAQTPAVAGGFGFTATQYAFAALPGTIIAFIVAPIAGGLARRIGWRPVMIVSTTIAAISALGLLVTMQSALPAFLFFTLVTFVFSGATMTAANALGVLLSPKRSPAFLPGIVSVMFSFGASFGIAVSGSMLSGSSLSAEPGAATATASFALAFAVALGLLIAAAALTFLVPTDRAQHPRRDTPNGELHAI
jgi:MFS family permease